MKIAAILGSPHGMAGNTGRVLTEVIRAAERAGAQVNTLTLNEYDVKPCRACDACHTVGQCQIKDDFPKVLQALQESDGIVLASPNYIFSVTAQLKALLDRCCGPLHLQNINGKYAAVVVTSGGSGGGEVQEYMLRFLRALGCATVGGVNAEAAELSDEKERAKVAKSAAQLGARLAEAIAKKEKFPEQEKERAAFFERMKQVVCWRKADWPYEYDYWRSQGRV